jgi:hypothetical protein
MNIDMMIFFMCGLWVGATVGALIMGVMAAAARADRWSYGQKK